MHRSPSRHRQSSVPAGIVCVATVVASVVASVGPAAAQAAGPFPPEPAARWEQTPFPAQYGGLSGIAVAGVGTVAVGFKIDESFRFTPLAGSWDGTKWDRQKVRLGLGPTADTQLMNADLLSPRRGWAVGRTFVAGGDRTVVVRWNGKAWRAQRTDALTGAVGLLGVAAVARNDVWAAGQEQVGSRLEPLLAHYDGNAWSPVEVPPLEGVGPNTALTSVSAESADSVWAVGIGGVMLHYDGTRWSQVELPMFGGGFAELQEVRSFGKDDTWAVGYASTSQGRLPLVLRWDGSDWQTMDVPDDQDAQLNDVARVAGGKTVAVGYSESGGIAFYGFQYAADGTLGSLALPRGKDALFGAAADPTSGELWVVGSGAVGSQGYISPYAALRR